MIDILAYHEKINNKSDKIWMHSLFILLSLVLYL